MFQYHLIIFILILCIPSLGIILPINYTGDVLGRWSSVDPEPGPGAAGGPRAPGASGALTGRPRRVIVVGASGGGGGGRDRESGGGGRGCLWGSASSPSRQPPRPP